MWWGGGSKRPAILTRAQQIETLRAAQPFAAQVPSDPYSWDIGLMRFDIGVRIRIRTTLPEAFPDDGTPPIVSVVERPATHPWLDSVSQRVIGSPELNSWNPGKNLGQVVSSIMQHFGSFPPTLQVARPPGGLPQPVPPAGSAMQQQQMRAPPAQQQQQYSPLQQYAAQQPFQQYSAQQPQLQQQQQLPSQPAPPGVAAGQQQQQSQPFYSANDPRGGPFGPGSGPGPLTRPGAAGQAGSFTPQPLTPAAAAPPPAPAPRQRSHTAMPPVPASFPELRALSLAQLEALAKDPAEQLEIVLAQESLSVFSTLATSQREETMKLAQENLDAQAAIAALREEAAASLVAAERGAAALQALLAERQSVLDRLTATRIARDLQATAQAIEAESEELAAQLTDPDAPPLGSGSVNDSSTSISGGGGGGGAAGGGGGASTVGSGTTGTGGAQLREFRESYIALRSRYHIANAKVELLQQGALVVPVGQ